MADRDGLAQVFDDWVISSEVGLRKPLPEIYELAAERLGLAPASSRKRVCTASAGRPSAAQNASNDVNGLVVRTPP